MRMQSLSRTLVLATVIGGISSSIAFSCAMIFPWQLLDNRKQTLLDIEPLDDFTNQIKRLVSISDKERANFQFGGKQAKTEDTLTSSNQDAKQCPNPDEEYKQAAILFHNQQWEDAYPAFTQLSYRSNPTQQVCARYSLARIEAALGKTDDARQSFASTAYLVGHGAPDPLHLGITAYGEEAGLILDNIGVRTKSMDANNQVIVTWKPADNLPNDSFFQLKQAAHLYVLQAALGEESGGTSLRVIIQGLLLNTDSAKTLLQQSASDPFMRPILIAYALRSTNFLDAIQQKDEQNIFTLLAKTNPPKDTKEDLSGLALLAYQNGQIQLAKEFAQKDWEIRKKSVDAWLLAKISLNQKDIQQAQNFYHEAITHFQDGTLRQLIQKRVEGEQAVLSLSQGNFIQAMEQLWPARGKYWGDIAYLAENVLTIDELKQFTDRHRSERLPRPKTSDLETVYTEPDPSILLSNLLARRLVRLNHEEQALPYFTDAKTQGFLKQYMQAKKEMTNDFWAVNRARATWEVAKIIKDHGFELTATEGYPDQYATEGYFVNGYGQPIITYSNADNAAWSVAEEQNRVKASWPSPNQRFHYRYVAADYALQSAELLPKQSQAYAALLCHATGWMLDTAHYSSVTFKDGTLESSWHEDSPFARDKAREIYQLYIKNGPLVEFGSHFGHRCPQPEFGKVEDVKRELFWKKFRHFFHPLKEIF